MLRRTSSQCSQRTSSSPNHVSRSSFTLAQSYSLGPFAPSPALNLCHSAPVKLWLGLKLHLLGYACFPASDFVFSPFLRQIKFPVEQGMPFRRSIRQKDT